MKQQEAEYLLNETFSKEFNLDKFVSFIKEILKGKININLKSFNSPSQFDEYISSFKKIGEYKSEKNNIEILAVELKSTKGASLERARTMQRNFVATWLKSTTIPKNGALVAFYGETLEDWRFSFVKMDYKFGEDGKVIKELTPAKRLSYLVGKHEPNHTCKKQFLDLLLEENIAPTMEELEKAFSIENVTKEFFYLYQQSFFELRDSLDDIIKNNLAVKKDFELKQINSTEFTKKLLGQIVFLYFLQKKGWLGVKKDNNGKLNEWGTGPKKFMTKLFNKEIVKYDNFFDDVLEPLFYEALAKSRDEDYCSRFECKIPFLNGGLFEAIKNYDWVNTKIQLDNEIFRKIIIETFDKFNFTIKEDEPLEREVAVDPEMLGKVFENLLDVKDRKSKGAFYTPREIVHYMCQQSLINYLETNTSDLKISREDLEKFILKGDLALDYLRRAQSGKKVSDDFMLPESIYKNVDKLNTLLKNIKICDPAVGSGAFPVGMMNEIVRARQILGYFIPTKNGKSESDYDLKRETIENCLYGVDIESSAVEITKLRFWLSLIVEENDMQNIKPLPNLDNKIMCGNSLIEEFEGAKLFNEDLLTGIHTKKEEKQSVLDKFTENKRKESEIKLNKLSSLQNEYFNEENGTKKKALMKSIENLEWEFIEATLKEQGNEEAMKKLEQYKNSKSKPFFLWKLYFSDVFRRDNPGFDIVIANPPYVRQEEFGDIKESIQREFRDFFNGRADLYTYFYKKGTTLLRNLGVLSFISSNKFFVRGYGENTRKLLSEEMSLLQIINFGELPVFSAAVDSAIILLEKKLPKLNEFVRAVQVKEALEIEDITNTLKKKGILIDLKKIGSKEWVFDSPKRLELLNKLRKNKITLREYYHDNLFAGIKTGLDSAFVINKEIKDKLIKKDPQSKEVIKPWFKGRDIRKWQADFKETYIIYIPLNRVSIDNYPAIKEHLEFYKKELEKRATNQKWFEMQQPQERFTKLFNQPKIIYPDCAKEMRACYDIKGSYGTMAMYFVPYDPLIAGILNSKLFDWYARMTFATFGDPWKGGRIIFKSMYMREVPIPEKSLISKKIEELVEQILPVTNDKNYLKNQDKQVIVKAFEKRIDKMVYELYELTPEEIKIVEGEEN